MWVYTSQLSGNCNTAPTYLECRTYKRTTPRAVVENLCLSVDELVRKHTYLEYARAGEHELVTQMGC